MRYSLIVSNDGELECLFTSEFLEDVIVLFDNWWKQNSWSIAFSVDGLTCKIYDSVEKKYIK
jgi:hypothetical protein